MKFIRAFIGNSVFALNVLLVFLVIFRDGLDVPVWLQPVGRMHPLLLHVPIGLLVLTPLLILFRSGFKKKSFHNVLNFVLYFGALTASLTAIMGLLLSREGGYNESQLSLHLAAGVALSLLSGLLLWVSLYELKRNALFNFALIANTAVLIAAGHFGSVLTHGDNFILQPITDNREIVITDSTSLYEAAVHPIMKAKCMSCHNDRKLKGDLNMSAVEKILKGGKHGPIWVSGKPDSSTLIKRIHLPEESDDHMPPSGKPQLTSAEMNIFYQWILEGADTKTPWTRFNVADSLRELAENVIHAVQKKEAVHYTFPPASPEVIQKLNTPFCTVAQIASGEPALSAEFFLSQAFDAKNLEALLEVKEQLVSLNLGKMPVGDTEGKIIGQFLNLERLNLNQTRITGNIFTSLNGLKHLKSISLTGTAVDLKSVEQFAGLPSLREIFVWNTAIAASDKISLQKKFPSIAWDEGYSSAEILRLTPPILVNEDFILRENEMIRLKHNLPGTRILYSLNGTDPDSVSGLHYKEPINLTQYSVVKTRSFKDGWYGSPVAEFYFFKQGQKPESVTLLNPPDKDYPGEGANTLINNKKGMAENFKDVAWLGYREKAFAAQFSLPQPNKVATVTLSYCENFSSFLLPPASVELWAGNDPAHFRLLQKIIPDQPKKDGPRNVKGIVFKVGSSTYSYFKLVAQPVAKVPTWVSKKPEKGWIFVDEVIFN